MTCRLAISSMSLGRAWVHKLEPKLDQAKRYGYEGIELFYEDLVYLAQETFDSTSNQDLLGAAAIVRYLCQQRNLTIVSLGPFSHCEGLLDTKARRQMFERLELWMQLALILGTDIIQIPSSFLSAEETTGDIDTIISDLTEVADRGAQHNLRFAYECLCWGTHNNVWEQSWNICQLVNRPNFGLCLDTFNIAGRVVADPTSSTGYTRHWSEDLKRSLHRLVNEVDVRKIFYVEVVDAEQLSEPLLPGHTYYDPSQPARMSWSRNCRLFYGEDDRGAYLPILEITKALLEKQRGLGFEGWVSFELFSRTMAETGPDVPASLAKRGALSWEKLCRDVNFNGVEVNGWHE